MRTYETVPKWVHELYNSKHEYRTFCAADEGDLCEADVSDLCEADDGKLAISYSRTPQFLSRFTEAFHAAKMLFFFVASPLR